MAEILHNGSANKADLFGGKITTHLHVKRCSLCGQMPVYCFPYSYVTDVEIYCDSPGCGFGYSSNSVAKAIGGWNRCCTRMGKLFKKEVITDE